MKFQGDDNAACSLCMARGIHIEGRERTTEMLIQLFMFLTNTTETEYIKNYNFFKLYLQK